MPTADVPAPPNKTCFLTTGATASFPGLIEAALSGPFLAALRSHEYTHLQLQTGAGGQVIYDQLYTRLQQEDKDSPIQAGGLSISSFEIDNAGLSKYMRKTKGSGSEGKEGEGCIISHAGSGSILPALRLGVPLIVVPNPDLLGNHQVELAHALAEQEYVIYGQPTDLAKALAEVEVWRKKRKSWPPVNAGVQAGRGLRGVLDDEMGFLD